MLRRDPYGDSIGEFAPLAKRRRPEIYVCPRRKHGGSKKVEAQYTAGPSDILKAPSAAFLRRLYRRGLCAGCTERYVAVEDRVDTHPLARLSADPRCITIGCSRGLIAGAERGNRRGLCLLTFRAASRPRHDTGRVLWKTSPFRKNRAYRKTPPEPGFDPPRRGTAAASIE